MAAVLAGLGLFVYLRVGDALKSSVDQGLRAVASETADRTHREDGLLHSGAPLVDPDAARGETIGQLLDGNGHVLRSTPTGLAPLVGARTASAALEGSILETRALPGRKSEWRVLARPVTEEGRSFVLVVASSLASREETLHRLLVELAVSGPIALILASLAGYGLAAAALHPVDSMRRRAAAISASTPGLRLPVPRSRDEIARLAETLNAMLGRLEASLEHERRFVADASHELRTPLALLRTELELALRRPRTHQELHSSLSSAAEETERLSRLAEDLLLIARSDQGGLPIRRRRVATDEALRATAERFAKRAAASGREILVEDDTGLAVDADPERLEQALGNLVDNALAHGEGTIELRTASQDALVELHVTDEGPGFPADFAARAFDRFSRADEARGRSGTGLGLSIVALIAEAHGGEAGARNREAGGADVWIAFERATLDAADDESAALVSSGR
jgi:signal transduction histidine kinase